MFRRLVVLILAFGLLSAVSGCAVKSGNTALEKTNSEEVAKYIIIGTSTKKTVKKKFGEPQKIDFTESGLEKWEYQHVRKAEKAVNYVPIANKFVKGTNDTVKTLIVIFKGDVVENFAMSTAEGETKTGIFQ